MTAVDIGADNKSLRLCVSAFEFNKACWLFEFVKLKDAIAMVPIKDFALRRFHLVSPFALNCAAMETQYSHRGRLRIRTSRPTAIARGCPKCPSSSLTL